MIDKELIENYIKDEVENDCYYCIKRGTQYCPKSSECYDTKYKPSFRTKELALREIECLKERINYLERSIARKEETIEDLRHDVQLDMYERVIEAAKVWIECHKEEWVDNKFETNNEMIKFNKYANPQALLDILNRAHTNEILRKEIGE